MPYPGGRSQMSDEGKLFIGGLDGEVTDTMLEEHFSKYGTVTNVAVVKDRETGKSRGFGFVTFENPQDAKDAMTAMDGKEIEGRAIRVDEAGKPSGRSGVFRGGSHLRGNFFRGGRRGEHGEGGGYSNRSYGDSGNDRGYGERSYSREGSYRGGRSYGDEDGGGFSRSFGSGGRGGGGGGGYNAGYRDSRSQSSYGGEQRTSYRENYDGYAQNE